MRYRNFGFSIDSDIELPYFIDLNDDVDAEIKISLVYNKPDIPNCAERYAINTSKTEQLICNVVEENDSLIMDFEDYICFKYFKSDSKYCFQYYCYNDYHPAVKERLIGRFGMAYLLTWMGMTVLHGSAVSINDQAICFVADSEGGKSSMVSLCISDGWLMMSDELVVLKKEKDRMILLPSSPYLQIDDETLMKIKSTHFPYPSVSLQFESEFMEEIQIVNRVNLESVSLCEPSNCKKITVLERGYKGEIKIHKYKKIDAYIKLLHYLYTPIIFPIMRKNLMSLMEYIQLEKISFNDCFLQFENIKNKIMGELS